MRDLEPHFSRNAFVEGVCDRPSRSLRVSCRIDVASSLNVWWDLPVEPCGSGACCVGRFSPTDLISFIATEPSQLSVLLQGALFQGMCPLHHCRIYWPDVLAPPFNISRLCSDVISLTSCFLINSQRGHWLQDDCHLVLGSDDSLIPSSCSCIISVGRAGVTLAL